jgi:hypothetical protein
VFLNCIKEENISDYMHCDICTVNNLGTLNLYLLLVNIKDNAVCEVAKNIFVKCACSDG